MFSFFKKISWYTHFYVPVFAEVGPHLERDPFSVSCVLNINEQKSWGKGPSESTEMSLSLRKANRPPPTWPSPHITVTSRQPESKRGRGKGSTSDPWLAKDATRLFHTLQPRLLCRLFHLESLSDPSYSSECPKKIQEDKVLDCARHRKEKSSHKMKTAF